MFTSPYFIFSFLLATIPLSALYLSSRLVLLCNSYLFVRVSAQTISSQIEKHYKADSLTLAIQVCPPVTILPLMEGVIFWLFCRCVLIL